MIPAEKILFQGDKGIGKSRVIKYICESYKNPHSQNYSILAIDPSNKSIKKEYSIIEQIDPQLNESEIVCVVYIVNVKNKTSYENVKTKYYPNTKYLFENNPQVVSLLQSNDDETSQQREVSNEDIESFASDNKMFTQTYDERSRKYFGLIRKAIIKKIGFSQGLTLNPLTMKNKISPRKDLMVSHNNKISDFSGFTPNKKENIHLSVIGNNENIGSLTEAESDKGNSDESAYYCIKERDSVINDQFIDNICGVQKQPIFDNLTSVKKCENSVLSGMNPQNILEDNSQVVEKNKPGFDLPRFGSLSLGGVTYSNCHKTDENAGVAEIEDYSNIEETYISKITQNDFDTNLDQKVTSDIPGFFMRKSKDYEEIKDFTENEMMSGVFQSRAKAEILNNKKFENFDFMQNGLTNYLKNVEDFGQKSDRSYKVKEECQKSDVSYDVEEDIEQNRINTQINNLKNSMVCENKQLSQLQNYNNNKTDEFIEENPRGELIYNKSDEQQTPKLYEHYPEEQVYDDLPTKVDKKSTSIKKSVLMQVIVNVSFF